MHRTAHVVGAIGCELRGCVIAAVTALALVASSAAAPAASEPAASDPGAAKIQELLRLLADPQVRSWIEQRGPAAQSAPEPSGQPGPAGSAAAAPQATDTAPGGADQPSASSLVAQQLASIRRHVAGLILELPQLPAEFFRAWLAFDAEFHQYGGLGLLFLAGIFVALGFGAEWAFRLLSKRSRVRLSHHPLETVGQRVQVVAQRFLLSVGLAGSFAIGSIGAFLASEWPPLLKRVVLSYLLAFLALRLAMAFGRFLLAPTSKAHPHDSRFRIIPINSPAARFWYHRLVLAVGWQAFGSTSINLLGAFGFSALSQTILSYGLDLGLLAIALESVWRSPDALLGRATVPKWYRFGRNIIAGALSLYVIALLLLWVALPHGVFALALVAGGLPILMEIAQGSVNHILRPPGAEWDDAELETLQAVILTRGVRALLIGCAALFVARAWNINLTELTTQDTLVPRVVRDVVNAVVVLLAADLIWHMARSVIDAKLRAVGPPGTTASDSDVHHARTRTLLPILRNVLLVTIVIVGCMTVLSSMGVAIGPLIASAGVLGVALGFGSQTLVRDVISGVFYLIDDAFRVGEYIQSGSYKGVVESFSLRSVKLRHHRGPLYTVPFGALGAVQNMSRDWTIEKLTVGVSYSTDLAKVKSLVKEIGKKLLQDPELSPHIIETLKMQGVENFGDYAIQLRMKMTTKPGEQFVVRRRALAMIKTAFEANGVAFAFPTVRVDGAQDSAAAAARQSLELVKPARTPGSSAA